MPSKLLPVQLHLIVSVAWLRRFLLGLHHCSTAMCINSLFEWVFGLRTLNASAHQSVAYYYFYEFAVYDY